APFGRDQVGPDLLEQDGILSPPLLLPVPAGERYYSLLAVDNRGTMSPF
ncbi:MAG: hypothetical protein HY509_04325, partial [Acidobacteria bacterium]|nr:hypothetical protein [Acidobacteriota bacterium]